MAITPIQVPSQAREPKERDEPLMDKILKGLQIANTVLGGYENIKSAQLKGAQADTEALKQGIAQRQAGGKFTEAEIGERKEQFLPGEAQEFAVTDTPSPLLPGPTSVETKSQLLPPQAFSGVPSRKGSLLTPEGEKEGYFASTADVEKKRADIDALTKDVNQISQTYNQADLNYKNILQSAPKAAASTEASEKLLVNAARLWNPNVSRISEIGADQSLPETIQKYAAYLTGKGSQKLNEQQVREIVDQSYESMLGYKEALDQNLAPFASRAGQRGITPEDIGIIEREIQEPSFKSKQGSSKKPVSNGSPAKNSLEQEFLDTYGG